MIGCLRTHVHKQPIIALYFEFDTLLLTRTFAGNIRIHHGCEGRIEKSVLRIAVWHHEACQVMTNVDLEGEIFLSYLHTNNGFFFLLTTVLINLFINLFFKKLPVVPAYARRQFHMMTLLDVLGKIAWVQIKFSIPG